MGAGEQDSVVSSARTERDRSEARLRALSDIGRAAVVAAPGTAKRQILLAAMRALEGDAASLGIWDDTAQLLRTHMNVGELAEWEEAEPTNEVYEADQSTWLAGMVDGQLGVALCLDDDTIAIDDREYLESLNKHSSMSVPVLYAGEWWAELFTSRKADKPPYTAADIEWGAAVAAQMGAALETLEHLDRIERLAQTDPLTGLANRRALDEWLESAMVELRERQRPVGLVVCDLNGLKHVNDEQGHDAGDRALVQFANQLVAIQRSFEGVIVARLGGDEFCFAMSGPQVAELPRAAHEISRLGWETLPYGVASGVVSTLEAIGPIETPGRLFRLADAAQYRAKRTGSTEPVFAGRPLPPKLAVPLVTRPDDDVIPDRRLLRGRDVGSASHLFDAALRALDQAAHEPVRTRLGLVADLVTHHIDAVGWWLSLHTPASGVAKTVEFALYRAVAGLAADEFDEAMRATFPLDNYPQTVLALSGGAFTIHRDDLTADPAELAILDGLHASAVIGAGGSDDEGDQWLVEVFTDDLSAIPAELASALRLLVLAALHPPPKRTG